MSLLSAFPSTLKVCKEAPSQQLGDAGAHALVVSPGARSWGGMEQDACGGRGAVLSCSPGGVGLAEGREEMQKGLGNKPVPLLLLLTLLQVSVRTVPLAWGT